MKENRCYYSLFYKVNRVKLSVYLVLLCISNTVLAQIKGKIVDQNNQPVPFVNIWVQGENIGTTSEEDGSFYLGIKEQKNLIFSALGYEKKTVNSSDAILVQLISTAYQLNEVVVLNKKETKTVEIGQTENAIYQAFENGPKMDARYFPYTSKVKKNRYLKKISIFTESNIEKASVKIHFYEVDLNGLPGEEMLNKDFVVSVKKGSRRTYYDISSLNLVFPKTGIFVAVERLMIEKNKFEKTVVDIDPTKTKIQRVYYPLLFYSFVEKEFSYTFYGGSWHKESKNNENNQPIKARIFEPAINLILTN
jgi:CarboxypepD_reg-like domain